MKKSTHENLNNYLWSLKLVVMRGWGVWECKPQSCLLGVRTAKYKSLIVRSILVECHTHLFHYQSQKNQWILAQSLQHVLAIGSSDHTTLTKFLYRLYSWSFHVLGTNHLFPLMPCSTFGYFQVQMQQQQFVGSEAGRVRHSVSLSRCAMPCRKRSGRHSRLADRCVCHVLWQYYSLFFVNN